MDCICQFLTSFLSQLQSALQTADAQPIQSDLGGLNYVGGGGDSSLSAPLSDSASNSSILTSAHTVAFVLLCLFAVLSVSVGRRRVSDGKPRGGRGGGGGGSRDWPRSDDGPGAVM